MVVVALASPSPIDTGWPTSRWAPTLTCAPPSPSLNAMGESAGLLSEHMGNDALIGRVTSSDKSLLLNCSSGRFLVPLEPPRRFQPQRAEMA